MNQERMDELRAAVRILPEYADLIEHIRDNDIDFKDLMSRIALLREYISLQVMVGESDE